MAKGISILLVMAMCHAIISCGGNPTNSSTSPSFVSTAGSIDNVEPVVPLKIQPRSVSLQAALSDLAELPVPTDVDTALFETMRDELASALVSFYGENGATTQWAKAASAVEPVSMNGAWCLDGKRMPSGEVIIKWRGNHLGDYDLNSEVNVADITPLVLHYMTNPLFDEEGLPLIDDQNESRAQTDGDNNGEVNGADITQIALNYSSRVVGYRLYPGTSADGTTFVWDSDFVPNTDDPGTAYSVAFNTSLEAGKIFRYSANFEYAQIPGVQLYVKVVPFDGTSEGSEQIIPVPEGPHAWIDCSTCHFVTSLEFRGAENSCHNCHSGPPEGRSTSWADAPGMHSNCNMCHGAHAFVVEDILSKCSECHGSIATAVTAAGMPDCMSCHEVAHVPEASPAPETCEGCHPVPPDADSLAWADAPGSHSNCMSCHSKHSFSNAGEPEMCAQCHATQVNGGHSTGQELCTNCHNSVHVPEGSATGLSCEGCHPNPPENLEVEWADAPGSHGNCVLCHAGTHGIKPIPAESICANCHQEKLDAGHVSGSTECMACHTFPHLPNVPEPLHDSHPVMNVNCSDCHDSGIKPRRDHCTACHEDKVDHNPPAVCQSCHPQN